MLVLVIYVLLGFNPCIKLLLVSINLAFGLCLTLIPIISILQGLIQRVSNITGSTTK